MRIAHVYPHSVISVAPPRITDALGVVNYEIARRLARDHSVVVYSRQQRGLPTVEEHEGVVWSRIPVGVDRALNSLKFLDALRLSPRSRPYRFSSLYYTSFAHTVAQDIRARQCEIVHIHGITNFITAVRHRNPDACIVLHVHDHSLADFDADLIGSRLRDAALILACSDHVAEGIRQRFPDAASRCHTLHNGVDEAFLQLATKPVESDTVLFVGRVAPEKGVSVLLEAFAEVAKRKPAADLRMVGPFDFAPRQFVDPFDKDPVLAPVRRFCNDPAAFRAHVLKTVQALAPRVRMEGVVPNMEMRRHYEQAGVFVFPSVWHEPFGIPLIEAMAAGLPVVTTRGGAASEVVIDGETGFLVNRGDVSSLASAVCTLLNDPDLRRRMGLAGRDRVARLFTWNRAVAKLNHLYERAWAACDAGRRSRKGAA